MGFFWKMFRNKNVKEMKSDAQYVETFIPVRQDILRTMLNTSSTSVFKKLWIAYKCITMIGENIGTLPYDLVDANGENTTDPIYEKLFTNPNPLDTGVDLLEQLAIYIILDGNGYLYVNGLSPEMWVLMSQHVTPMPGDSQNLIGYYKDAAGSKEKRYSPEEIIHIKLFNPASRISGMSKLSAGRGQMGFSELSENYKNKLYQNQATPSGIFATDDALSDQQFERLQKEINNKYAGTNNAGRPMLLEAGLHWEKLAFNPADLDLIKSENMTWSSIATLLGVPTELLGDLGTQKNFANYREARRAFYEETIIPMATKMLRAISRYFWTDGSKKLVINLSEISALKPTSEELLKSYWTTGNEKRIKQGLKPYDSAAMDEIYLPANLISINDASGDMGSTEL